MLMCESDKAPRGSAHNSDHVTWYFFPTFGMKESLLINFCFQFSRLMSDISLNHRGGPFKREAWFSEFLGGTDSGAASIAQMMKRLHYCKFSQWNSHLISQPKYSANTAGYLTPGYNRFNSINMLTDFLASHFLISCWLNKLKSAKLELEFILPLVLHAWFHNLSGPSIRDIWTSQPDESE